MRIVMVAHSFPRVEGDVAGAFIWRFADALVDRGHRVLVIAPADQGDVGAPTLGRVEVRRVRYAPARRETLGYTGMMHGLAVRSPSALVAFAGLILAMRRAVAAECRSGDVHVVHAHWWVPGGVAAALANRHGRPLVITLHGTDVALAQRIPGAQRVMGAVLRRAAALTAVSTYLAEQAAAAARLDRSAITVTPMPLATMLPRHPPETRRGIIYVGRLTQQKGVNYMLEALAMLRRTGFELDVTVVGDGPERVALKAQALALNVPVRWVGFVPPEQVADYLDGKRLLVLPSINEGLGLVVAEALTQGVPVVASRSGGIPDLLTHPEAGLLVPPADPKALSEAIKTVLTQDRFVYGAEAGGRELAERLSPAKVAERLEEVYLRSRGSRRSSATIPKAAG